jgi:hypothetical protein
VESDIDTGHGVLIGTDIAADMKTERSGETEVEVQFGGTGDTEVEVPIVGDMKERSASPGGMMVEDQDEADLQNIEAVGELPNPGNQV